MRRFGPWVAMVWMSWAGLSACGGGGGGMPPTEPLPPPDPYAPPSSGAPTCELSADCPAGTHCDLGECIQTCNTVDPCTGELVCIARGRCAESADAPADPPIEAEAVSLRVDVGQLLIGESDNVAILEIAVTPMSETLRYRIAPQVSWLRVADPRGEMTGALTVMLEVDRSRLAPGTYDGTVIVKTTGGDVVVPVHLQQGITAAYEGVFEYDTPRPLGTSHLRLDMVESGGFVNVRIDPLRSPTFPALGGRSTTATWRTEEGGRLRGSIVQRLTPSDFGPGSLLDRDVGRTFEVDLTVSEAGGYEGRFTEYWTGIASMPIATSGTVSLDRLPGVEVGEFSVASPPPLPSNPDPNPPTLTSACVSVAQTLVPAGTSCAASASAANLARCGQAMLTAGTRLDDPSVGLLVGDASRGYESFVDACANDFDAMDTGPSAARASCLRRDNLNCAVAFFGRAAQGDVPEGFRGIDAVASAHAGAGALLVNQTLVDAFSAPFSQTVEGAAVGRAMADSLDDGRERGLAALRPIFEPFVIDTLARTPSSLAGEDEFQALRRTALLVSRLRMALEEAADLRARRQAVDTDALRAELGQDALQLQVLLATLSTVEEEQRAPESPEIGLFAESLTRISNRFLQLDEEQPFGIPEGFVEFLFDPASPAAGSTNFEQVLAARRPLVTTAIAAEETAEASVRAFDDRIEALEEELLALRQDLQGTLRALCGASPSDPTAPDLDNCGSGGRIAQARLTVEEAQEAMRLAVTRVEGLVERVRIQERRLRDVYQIRSESIAFVSQTGAEIITINALDSMLGAVQQMLSTAAGTGLFTPGAAGCAAAIFALSFLRTGLQVQRENLQLLQSLTLMTADRDIEFLNGMATIRDMLVGLAELTIEVNLAGIRVATAVQELRDLEVEVEALRAEGALREARAVDPSRSANDASFRVLRDQSVVRALAAREEARRGIYLAARAWEFEHNTRLPSIGGLIGALEAGAIGEFADCLERERTNFRSAYGTPQVFVDELSLREDVLGIRGPRVDPVTGEELSEAEQFRRLFYQPSNLGPDGTVGLTFPLGLATDNGVFSTGVCNDQIRSIQVRLIGDGLGDDQARVYLEQTGTSVVRSCSSFRSGRGDRVESYDLVARRAEVQAGINVYASSPADTQFFGRSVAASGWRVAIPPGSAAPSNRDLDPLDVEDIVLRIEHAAVSLTSSPIEFTPQCGG